MPKPLILLLHGWQPSISLIYSFSESQGIRPFAKRPTRFHRKTSHISTLVCKSSRCHSLGGSRLQLIKIWGMYDNDSITYCCIPMSDLFRELQQNPSNYALIVKIWTYPQAGNLFIFYWWCPPHPPSNRPLPMPKQMFIKNCFGQ